VSKYPNVSFSNLFQRVERKIILDDGETYQRIGVRWYGLGAFIRDSELGMNISRKQQWVVEAGDVIYNKLFAWKGSFAIAGADVHGHIASDKFPTYQHDAKRLDLNYLRYYFQTPNIAKQAENLSKGAAAISKLTLNPPQFWDLTIPLPPLAEQQRVVARIEALAGKIAAARRLRAEAALESTALLTSAISIPFNYDEVEHLPYGWRWYDFRDLLVEDGIRTGPFGTLLSKADLTQEGVPILGIANVQANVFISGFKDFVSESKAIELDEYRLKQGDIVVARSGTVGRSCVIPNHIEEIPIMSTNLIRIRVDRQKIDPILLCYILNGSALIERHKERFCRGSTRIFFTQKILFKLQIPVPSIEQQNKIVHDIESLRSQLNSLNRYQQNTQRELDALLPAILDRAFKGEL
jgi:type I restriction enzyme, S subunit